MMWMGLFVLFLFCDVYGVACGIFRGTGIILWGWILFKRGSRGEGGPWGRGVGVFLLISIPRVWILEVF